MARHGADALDALPVRLRVGDRLYSNRREPILELVEDTVGVHDLLFPPCDPKRYAVTWGQPGHRNCLTNLTEALGPYGSPCGRYRSRSNLFQKRPCSRTAGSGTGPIHPRAGDHATFRALKDVVCAVSSCPMDLTAANGGTITDLRLSVRG